MAADPLEAEFAEALAGAPPTSPPSQVPREQRYNYTHAAMIDMLLAEPWVSQNELARRFGYSASWISTMMATDAFQVKLSERSAEVMDPRLKATLDEQFAGIQGRCLELLRSRLSKPDASIPDQLVIKALEVTSRAKSYGIKAADAPAEVHIHLDEMSDRLVGLLRTAKSALPLIEGESARVAEHALPPA